MWHRPLETEANTQKTEILFIKYCLIGSIDCLYKWEGVLQNLKSSNMRAFENYIESFLTRTIGFLTYIQKLSEFSPLDFLQVYVFAQGGDRSAPGTSESGFLKFEK